MKAIKTTILAPTDRLGTRIKATDEDGNAVILPYRHELRDDENHARAATALCEKIGWDGELCGGSLKHGMVWVFISPSTPCISVEVQSDRKATHETLRNRSTSVGYGRRSAR
jgi:hypothetical protein